MNREVVTIILVIIGSFAMAKLVEWIVSRGLPRFAHRIHASFGERAVELLKGPAFNTVLLIGLGSAWALAHPPERLAFIGNGIIKSLVVLVWLNFANQFSIVLLKWMMREEGRFKAIHPATLPLFEFIAKIGSLGARYLFHPRFLEDQRNGMARIGRHCRDSHRFRSQRHARQSLRGSFHRCRYALPCG